MNRWVQESWSQLAMPALLEHPQPPQHPRISACLYCAAEGGEVSESLGHQSLAALIRQEEAAVARVCTHRSVIHRYSYLHRLLPFTLGPEKSFAIPLGLARESFATPLGLRHLGPRRGHVHIRQYTYKTPSELSTFNQIFLGSQQPRKSLEPLVIPG